MQTLEYFLLARLAGAPRVGPNGEEGSSGLRDVVLARSNQTREPPSNTRTLLCSCGPPDRVKHALQHAFRRGAVLALNRTQRNGTRTRQNATHTPRDATGTRRNATRTGRERTYELRSCRSGRYAGALLGTLRLRARQLGKERVTRDLVHSALPRLTLWSALRSPNGNK